MLTELCAFNDYRAFNDILAATKDFVAKSDVRPIYQMVFLRGEKKAPYTISDQVYHHDQVTAIALDGYKISHEICTYVSVEEDFTAYIYIPRIKATKTDIVRIYRDEDGTIVLSYENFRDAIQFRNKQPENPSTTHEDLYQKVSETATDLQIGVNASYLDSAAMSLKDRDGVRRPTVISTALDSTKPIKLTKQNSTRIILPVRICPNINT